MKKMNPKIKKLQETPYEKYNRYHSWFENEYSIFKFTDKEWNRIYREFGGITNKQVHMPKTDRNPHFD